MQRLPKEMKHAVPEDTTDETPEEGDVQGHAYKTVTPDPPFMPRRPSSGGELTDDDDTDPDQVRSN